MMWPREDHLFGLAINLPTILFINQWIYLFFNLKKIVKNLKQLI